jgi:hypothetical protein
VKFLCHEPLEGRFPVTADFDVVQPEDVHFRQRADRAEQVILGCTNSSGLTHRVIFPRFRRRHQEVLTVARAAVGLEDVHVRNLTRFVGRGTENEDVAERDAIRRSSGLGAVRGKQESDEGDGCARHS